MLSRKTHIIEQQKIEIIFEQLDNAIGVQERIAEVFYQRVQPEMELLFDNLVGEKEIVTIDRLEIDCGILTSKTWETEWVDKTIQIIKEKISAADNKKLYPQRGEENANLPEAISDAGDDIATNATSSFFFFLENGHLPWNHRARTIKEIEALVPVTAPLVSRLKELIVHHPFVAQRLANQFSKNFRKNLIDALVLEKDLRTIFSLVDQMKIEVSERMIDSSILSAFSLADEGEHIKVFLKKMLDQADEKNRSEIKKIAAAYHKKDFVVEKKTAPKKESIVKPETGSLYINNAGLIILHPFLPQLFQELGFLKNRNWINKEARDVAASVLEFIATGETEPAEFNMTLNKILCGAALTEVLTPVPEIQTETVLACEALIKEIIQHWSVLKNTGIESFRETFLRRDGKLTRVDDGWFLKVEQKGVDILLGHLPWGIGTIKLPWMEGILYVEWS